MNEMKRRVSSRFFMLRRIFEKLKQCEKNYSLGGFLSPNNYRDAILALEDGTIFRGVAIGSFGLSVGEVVFNTAITGYQEILTDASYARQIVTVSYTHLTLPTKRIV